MNAPSPPPAVPPPLRAFSAPDVDEVPILVGQEYVRKDAEAGAHFRVLRLKEDGYAILQVTAADHALVGSSIIKEFWELHAFYQLVGPET